MAEQSAADSQEGTSHAGIKVGPGALSKTKAQLGTEEGRHVRMGQPSAPVVYLDIDQLGEPDGDSEHVNLEGP